MTRHHTSSYHPQTNSAVKRHNSTLASSLRAHCNKNPQTWPELLNGIMMSIRKAPNMQSTEFSPFHMLFGQEMHLPFDVSLMPKMTMGQDAKQYMEEFLEHLKYVNQVAQENNAKNQDKNKQRYDKNATSPDFGIGDEVLLKVNYIPKGQSRKMTDKSEGPYVIMEKGPNFTYKLRNVETNKVRQSLVNASQLKPYKAPVVYRDHSQDQNTQRGFFQDVAPTNSQNVEPTPGPSTQNTQHDPNKRFKIKEILRGRKRHNRPREFRILWETGQRTWEPETVFDEEDRKELDRLFTKIGTKRKTYFTRRRNQ